MSRAYGQAAGLLSAAAASVAFVALAYGCSSFSATSAAPDGDAGGEEESSAPADASSADAASNDGAPVPMCTPRDVAADAGTPDSSCDGVGTTDLQSSDGHCGVCRHSCLGEGCQSGQCRVMQIAPITAVADRPPAIGVIADSFLYFEQAGTVSRMPSSGAAPAGIFMASALGGTDVSPPFVVNNRGWTVMDRTKLVSFELDGSGMEKVEATANIGPTATDGTSVFYADSNVARVWQVPSTTPIYEDVSVPGIIAIAADGDGLYLMVHVNSIASSARLLVRSPAGNVNETVVPGLVVPTVMLLDGGYLYWADVSGYVWRLAKGSTMAEPVMKIPLPTYIKGLAVDAVNVYAVTTADGQGGTVQASFYVAPKCGGPARLLRSDLLYGGALAADAAHLYWTHSDAIERIAK